jgi:hypothetical protein
MRIRTIIESEGDLEQPSFAEVSEGILHRARESANPAKRVSAKQDGGDGGIRTLDRALQPYNGLANRRLQPLGHISGQADMPDAGASRKRQISGRPIPGRSKPPGCYRSPPAPLEPWQTLGPHPEEARQSAAKPGVSKDGSLHGRHPRPSFETHRYAMLLRMRLGEDWSSCFSRQRRHGSSSSFRNDV